MKLKRSAAVIAAFLAGAVAAWFGRGKYDELKEAYPRYEALKNALYRSLAENDHAHAYASDEDLVFLKKEFAFLETSPTPREKIIALIAWIDANTKTNEVLSVRATELYKAKSGACEIHALAISVLRAYGIRARWISNVKSSIGFGYLEAFTGGKWELFRLRSGVADPSLHKSAWELYQESEPGLSIRNFWWKPGQTWSSWKGSVYPVLFPFANVEDHPEVETILRTDGALTSTRYRTLNPYDYVYGYFGAADGEWTREETVMINFEKHFGSAGMRSAKRQADLINVLGLPVYQD